MSAPRSSVPAIRAAKRRDGAVALVMVTAYDEPGARLADAAGVDMILVGDSVGDNVLGFEDTLQVTIEMMVHHVGAVSRARPEAMIIGDLPWMSYHLSPQQAVESAAALIRAGAGSVKLEGGANRGPAVRAILDAEIPVMGHVGLTPQSVRAMGGYRVQGRSNEAADALRESVAALEEADVIRIGAGPGTDGQVLVFHDLLGLGSRQPAKFVRRYAEIGSQITSAIEAWAEDVRSGAYPSEAESYAASDELRQHLDEG